MDVERMIEVKLDSCSQVAKKVEQLRRQIDDDIQHGVRAREELVAQTKVSMEACTRSAANMDKQVMQCAREWETTCATIHEEVQNALGHVTTCKEIRRELQTDLTTWREMKQHTTHRAGDSRGTMGQWEPAVQNLSRQIAAMRVTGSTQTAELKTYVDQQVTETGRRFQETLQRDIRAQAATLTTGVQKQLADPERALERKIGVRDPWTECQGEIRKIEQRADRQMQKLQTGVAIDLQGLEEQITAVQEMEHALKDKVCEGVRQVTEYVDNQISAATTAQRRQRVQDLKKIMTEVESQGCGIQEQAQQDMHWYVEQCVKEVQAGLAEELQDRSGRVHGICQSGDVQMLQEALRKWADGYGKWKIRRPFQVYQPQSRRVTVMYLGDGPGVTKSGRCRRNT